MSSRNDLVELFKEMLNRKNINRRNKWYREPSEYNYLDGYRPNPFRGYNNYSRWGQMPTPNHYPREPYEPTPPDTYYPPPNPNTTYIPPPKDTYFPPTPITGKGTLKKKKRFSNTGY